MGIPPFEPARRDESNGGIPILLQPLEADIFDETSNSAVLKVIKMMAFRQLTQHPVSVEK